MLSGHTQHPFLPQYPINHHSLTACHGPRAGVATSRHEMIIRIATTWLRAAKRHGNIDVNDKKYIMVGETASTRSGVLKGNDLVIERPVGLASPWPLLADLGIYDPHCMKPLDHEKMADAMWNRKVQLYQGACSRNNYSFTPLIFSAYGTPSRQTVTILRRLFGITNDNDKEAAAANWELLLLYRNCMREINEALWHWAAVSVIRHRDKAETNPQRFKEPIVDWDAERAQAELDLY